MVQKKTVFLAKAFLFLGFSVAALAIAETHPAIVRALEPHEFSLFSWFESPKSSSGLYASVKLIQHSGRSESGGSESPEMRSLDQIHAPHLTTVSVNPTPQTQPRQSEYLAVNTEPIDSGEAAEVNQVDPSQISATSTDWLGASFPVENFQTYTSPFGYRQSPDGSYSQEFHYGLDMAAPEGSYVRSWWSGTVVEVSDDSNCGTSVVIESGDWLHIYCHMQGYVSSDDTGRYMIDREGGIQIWEGQEIPAGGRIGRVGMTGRTTGPHLHWGLKYEGNWVDPALVLRAMYASQQTALQP
jgi:murein DD-endopeptidase MepM/ murein hydrolase activator NlpD